MNSAEDILARSDDTDESIGENIYELFLQMNPDLDPGNTKKQIERVDIVPPRPAPKKIRVESDFSVLTQEEEEEKDAMVKRLKSIIINMEDSEDINSNPVGLKDKSSEYTPPTKEELIPTAMNKGKVFNLTVKGRSQANKMIKDTDDLKEEQTLYNKLVRESVTNADDIEDFINIFNLKDNSPKAHNDNIRKELYNGKKKLVKQEYNKITLHKKEARIELPREIITSMHSKGFETGLVYFNETRPKEEKPVEVIQEVVNDEPEITEHIKVTSGYMADFEWTVPSKGIPSNKTIDLEFPTLPSKYETKGEEDGEGQEVDALGSIEIPELEESQLNPAVLEESNEEVTPKEKGPRVIYLNHPQADMITHNLSDIVTETEHTPVIQVGHGAGKMIDNLLEQLELEPAERKIIKIGSKEDLYTESEVINLLDNPHSTVSHKEITDVKIADILEDERTLDIKVEEIPEVEFTELVGNQQPTETDYSDELSNLSGVMEGLSKTLANKIGPISKSEDLEFIDQTDEEYQVRAYDVGNSEIETELPTIKGMEAHNLGLGKRIPFSEILGPNLKGIPEDIQPIILESNTEEETPYQWTEPETLRDDLMDTLLEDTTNPPVMTEISLGGEEEERFDDILIDTSNDKITSDTDYFIHGVDDNVEIY